MPKENIYFPEIFTSFAFDKAKPISEGLHFTSKKAVIRRVVE